MRRWISLISVILLAFYGLSVVAEEVALRYKALTAKPFVEVMADLEFAISEYNFRITGYNRVGEAIAERQQSSFPQATVVHFCNLEYAREFLVLAADYLLHMPCRIAVYEQDQQVVVEARLLPEDDPRLGALSRRN